MSDHNKVDLGGGRTVFGQINGAPGKSHLTLSYGEGVDRKTYGIDLKGQIMNGKDFSQPQNPKQLLEDAHKVLNHTPWVQGEKKRHGFDSIDHVEMTAGIEKQIDSRPETRHLKFGG